jgi:multimeric flavodoxin WrbA
MAGMKALALNCTLKRSPDASNTAALAQVVLDALVARGADAEMIRVADHVIEPGVVSEAVSDADEWPALRAKVVAADILVVATPTWLGQPSSIAKRVLERMDAMLSETKDDGRPIAYDKVAGVVVTGNEDGAHHCISEISGALVDIGYTVACQGWTYWNKGPGPGEEEYLSTDEKEWSNTTGKTAAQNLMAVAEALAAHPIPAPAS